MTFDDAVVDHLIVTDGDLRIPIIGRAALIRNKTAANRAVDAADVKKLLR